MQFQVEYPGMAENFKELIKNYTSGLNQRNIQWANLTKTMSQE